MTAQPIWSCRELVLGFASSEVLSIDHLAIDSGSTVGILGASGAGKSTLLAAIAGGGPVRSGTVESSTPTRSAPSVGLVPQFSEPSVDPLCVAEAVALGRVRRGLRTTPAERARVTTLLDRVGLTGFERRPIETLSGGQRQRVAIARALMRDPDILLCDEPTSGADPALAAEIVDHLVALAADGTAVVVATHDLSVVPPRVDRILGVAHGRVVVDCPADELSTAHLVEIYGPGMRRP